MIVQLGWWLYWVSWGVAGLTTLVAIYKITWAQERMELTETGGAVLSAIGCVWIGRAVLFFVAGE
jgi:hypothetical protein